MVWGGSKWYTDGDGREGPVGVGFGTEGPNPVMVGLGLAVGFRDGLPLMSPPCRTSPPLASGLADGSDGGSGDGGLGLSGELLASGLGLAILGTREV